MFGRERLKENVCEGTFGTERLRGNVHWRTFAKSEGEEDVPREVMFAWDDLQGRRSFSTGELHVIEWAGCRREVKIELPVQARVYTVPEQSRTAN